MIRLRVGTSYPQNLVLATEDLYDLLDKWYAKGGLMPPVLNPSSFLSSVPHLNHPAGYYWDGEQQIRKPGTFYWPLIGLSQYAIGCFFGTERPSLDPNEPLTIEFTDTGDPSEKPREIPVIWLHTTYINSNLTLNTFTDHRYEQLKVHVGTDISPETWSDLFKLGGVDIPENFERTLPAPSSKDIKDFLRRARGGSLPWVLDIAAALHGYYIHVPPGGRPRLLSATPHMNWTDEANRSRVMAYYQIHAGVANSNFRPEDLVSTRHVHTHETGQLGASILYAGFIIPERLELFKDIIWYFDDKTGLTKVNRITTLPHLIKKQLPEPPPEPREEPREAPKCWHAEISPYFHPYSQGSNTLVGLQDCPVVAHDQVVLLTPAGPSKWETLPGQNLLINHTTGYPITYEETNDGPVVTLGSYTATDVFSRYDPLRGKFYPYIKGLSFVAVFEAPDAPPCVRNKLYIEFTPGTCVASSRVPRILGSTPIVLEEEDQYTSNFQVPPNTTPEDIVFDIVAPDGIKDDVVIQLVPPVPAPGWDFILPLPFIPDPGIFRFVLPLNPQNQAGLPPLADIQRQHIFPWPAPIQFGWWRGIPWRFYLPRFYVPALPPAGFQFRQFQLANPGIGGNWQMQIRRKPKGQPKKPEEKKPIVVDNMKLVLDKVDIPLGVKASVDTPIATSAPHEVTLQWTTTGRPVAIQVDWGDSSPIEIYPVNTPFLKKTYAAAGAYKIIVTAIPQGGQPVSDDVDIAIGITNAPNGTTACSTAPILNLNTWYVADVPSNTVWYWKWNISETLEYEMESEMPSPWSSNERKFIQAATCHTLDYTTYPHGSAAALVVTSDVVYKDNILVFAADNNGPIPYQFKFRVKPKEPVKAPPGGLTCQQSPLLDFNILYETTLTPETRYWRWKTDTAGSLMLFSEILPNDIAERGYTTHSWYCGPPTKTYWHGRIAGPARTYIEGGPPNVAVELWGADQTGENVPMRFMIRSLSPPPPPPPPPPPADPGPGGLSCTVAPVLNFGQWYQRTVPNGTHVWKWLTPAGPPTPRVMTSEFIVGDGFSNRQFEYGVDCLTPDELIDHGQAEIEVSDSRSLPGGTVIWFTVNNVGTGNITVKFRVV